MIVEVVLSYCKTVYNIDRYNELSSLHQSSFSILFDYGGIVSFLEADHFSFIFFTFQYFYL